MTEQDIIQEKIEAEFALIEELESMNVVPEYYRDSKGRPISAKGDYARHITKIKDAHWRIRQLTCKEGVAP